jgi:hypothetical protein
MRNTNLLIGDCTQVSQLEEDPEIVVLELLTPAALSDCLIGELIRSPVPYTLMACLFGDMAVVGQIEPIDPTRFRIAGEVFNYDEVDSFVIFGP